MTINSTDIKLLQSERMADTANGGGRKTSRVVVDGEAGNIFPKVSRLDSVYGRVNLRKVYGAVTTENLDVYAGAHAVVTDAPDNAEIHVNIFSTDSDYDTRTAARDRIESYVITGPESRIVLYGRQLVGQQAILCYQRVEDPLPEVGDVYCLSKETGGVVAYQQYLRITDLEQEIRTISDANGDFTRRVMSLKIGAALRYQFEGPESPSRFTNVAKPAVLRETSVADAARYFGIKKLSELAPENSLSVKVDSVYSAIVPTTQRESAVSLATIAGAGLLAPTADAVRPRIRMFYSELGDNEGYKIRTATLPTLAKRAEFYVTLTRAHLTSGPVLCPASGVIPAIGFPEQTGIRGGTLDFETGVLTVDAIFGNANTSIFISYTPAVEAGQPARTREIPITLATRGTVYSEVLNQLPAPGSTIVDYRALGKWYRLRDDGQGKLSGNDTAYGVGTVDYVTGALVITLGALPDIDSSVIISWGSYIDYEILAGATSDSEGKFFQEFTLAATLPINPGSFSFTFLVNGVAKAVTSDSSGVISGNGVLGTIDHTQRLVRFTYSTFLPDPGSSLTLSYQQLDPAAPLVPAYGSGAFTVAADSVTVATGSPVTAGSFRAQVQYKIAFAASPELSDLAIGAVDVYDNGSGALLVRGGKLLSVTAPNGGGLKLFGNLNNTVQVGSINYATGELSLTGGIAVRSTVWNPPGTGVNGVWVDISSTATVVVGSSATYQTRIKDVATTPATMSQTVALADSPLKLKLLTTKVSRVTPGSVIFTIAGKNFANVDYDKSVSFYDRSGAIYCGTDVTPFYASEAGSIDYATGVVTVNSGWFSTTNSHTLTVNATLCKFGNFTTADSVFKIAGSPLRPASFYVQAEDLAGNLLSATSTQGGVVSGTGIVGQVNQTMGIASVEFSSMVDPNSIRYSCVVLSNLPLNADILGLDPVRLPSDGRVPIYRPADVVVIHNTQAYSLPDPPVAGTAYSVGRTTLSDLWLIDANGVKLPTTKYTVNLSTGVVTMAADLDLTGYVGPFNAKHRIEEMQLLSDVQINGLLSLTAPLSREYPLDSYVSSALLFGDLSAELPVFFDQGTWSGVWQASVIGSAASAQYNDIDYPLELLNSGAVTDRWRLNFTSGNPSSGTAAFQIISENLGVIGTGSTGVDCAPVNALTNKPYFTIRAAGWGLGWAIGNQLRFDTKAASRPVWIARTVLPGATLNGDSFDMQVRGDVDA